MLLLQLFMSWETTQQDIKGYACGYTGSLWQMEQLQTDLLRPPMASSLYDHFLQEHPYLIRRNQIWGTPTCPVTGLFQSRNTFCIWIQFYLKFSRKDTINLPQVTALALTFWACRNQQSWTKLHPPGHLKRRNRVKCPSCATKPGEQTKPSPHPGLTTLPQQGDEMGINASQLKAQI